MGQSSSCFADNTDGNILRLDTKNRSSFHPLSSQDAEIHRNRDSSKSIAVSSGPTPLTSTDDPENTYSKTNNTNITTTYAIGAAISKSTPTTSVDSEAHHYNNIFRAGSKDTMDTTTSSIKSNNTRGSTGTSTSQRKGVVITPHHHHHHHHHHQQQQQQHNHHHHHHYQENRSWRTFPTLKEEDIIVGDSISGSGDGHSHNNTSTTTMVDKQFSNSIPSHNKHNLLDKKKQSGSRGVVLSSLTKKADKVGGELRQRKLRFIRWKKKDNSSKFLPSKSTRNGIMTLTGVDTQHKTMYYFPRENSNNHNLSMNGMSVYKKHGRHDKFAQEYCDSVIEINSSNDAGNPQRIVEYAGSNQTITKLVTRDMIEVKSVLLNKIHNRLKKDSYLDPILVCGAQIFATRYGVNDRCYNDNESAIKSDNGTSNSNSNSLIISVEDVNPGKVSSVSSENLKELLKKTQSFDSDIVVSKEDRGNRFKARKVLQPQTKLTSFSNEKGSTESLLAATVPPGVGRKLFTERAVLRTNVEAVPDIVCVNSENKIFVCDIGLTSSRCDFIVDAAERCSKGSYNAYTYAKQTLGCREFDELAVVCEWPVMRAITSIRQHLEEHDEQTKRGSEERAPLYRRQKRRILVLDEREPHIVKYDVSRRERQKLDMHTDKSEWTFLIALTDGGGDDYDGGGTYFECIDSTVHLEKGHALIFPGRLRHRGQKIVSGKRFLLVGFLVEKQDEWCGNQTLCDDDDDNSDIDAK